MNRVNGMSLKQFYDVLEEMRTIYPYEAEKTYLGELRDLASNTQNQVEIMTTDEKTGILIIMSKGVNRGENEGM